MASRNNIVNLNPSKTLSLPSGWGYTPQSFAYINDSKIIVACSNPTNSGKNNFLICNVPKNNYTKKTKVVTTGHASGCTYCPKNGLIYVTNGKTVTALDASSLSKRFTVSLSKSAVGFAYDRITNKFYASSGGKIYVYPFDAFAKGGTYSGAYSQFTISTSPKPVQDIGGHNGVVMTSTSSDTTSNNATTYVDCFDSSSGKLLCSYKTKGELESIIIGNDNTIYALYAQNRRIIKMSNKFNLKGSSASGIVEGTNYSEYSEGAVLYSSTNKLYRSDNFEYLEEQVNENNQTKDLIVDSIKKSLESISNSNYGGIPDTPQIVFALTQNTSGEFDNTKRRQTKLEGEVFGPSLPTALDPVEAPFAEITIGGFAFGIYEGDGRYDKYPNYIDSINVRKTNGSMNEYTINLIHQVRPGSNPNFIDELLSKNGYNKIIIRYGDANSGVEFIDSNALLVGVNVSFDFINCNIKYTLKATSSAVSIASHKRTFSSIEDKPSNIIRDLLYNDANEDLLTAFPRMRDKNFVEKNNLIPNNDSVVEVDEFKNINAVSYLSSLVSIMKSNVDDIVNSNYMLTINDGYFKINEISNNYSYDASLYEVNINFPDDNQVFDFSIDTDYSWPIAYEYSGDVSNYNYDINNIGNSVTYTTNSSHLLDFSSPSQDSLNNNWWKQVTEFPVSAKLTCRGLLSPQLLLTYIKINCIYFGSERIISGVYIVTGQEDSLSGSGYKTTLSLLRVASSKQHIIVDGRVKT